MAASLPSVLLVVIIYSRFLNITSTLNSPSQDPEFRQHYQLVRAFRCSAPRATAVPLTVLLPTAEPSKQYLPEMTVLHRCDTGAGCCLTPGHVCGPAATENVSLPFHVTYMLDVVGHPRGSEELERVTAVNHTRCQCVERGHPPR